MRAMHEEQQADGCLLDVGSSRSDLSQGGQAQAGAPRRMPDTLSVRPFAAPEPDPDAAMLAVHGELDIETAPVLREALAQVLENQAGPVVVDLTEVAFMDSTGVHVLFDTLQRLDAENRRLALACREGGPVHRVLGLVGLLDALTVHRSREGAVIGDDDLLKAELDRGRPPSAAGTLTRDPSRAGPPEGTTMKAS